MRRMKQDSLVPMFSDLQANPWEVKVTLATRPPTLQNVQTHPEGWGW